MPEKKPPLIAAFIGLLILYSGHLFIVWVHQSLLDNPMDLLSFLVPIILIILTLTLMFAFKSISDCIHSITFKIGGFYLCFLLYSIQVAIPLKIIDLFSSIDSKISLSILYVIPLIICIYGVINAKISKYVSYTLKYPGYENRTKILHLSDIHLGALHQLHSIKNIIKEINDLNPDIVVITGDLADGTLKVKEEWLSPFNTLKIPILYITGNHEEMNPYEDMIDVVNKTQIKHIGRHETFEFKGINFIGEDFRYKIKEIKERLKEEKIKENMPNVLLYHVPCIEPNELEEIGLFLVLAGHTHGGQIWPFHIPAYFANKCFNGLYSDRAGKHFVYVSPGVNNSVCPMRIGTRRTFAMITIEGE